MKTHTTLNKSHYIKFVFLIGILIFSSTIHSQKVTTLLQTLKTFPNDSTRIKPLIQLADYYAMTNQDSAIFYLRKASLLEKKTTQPFISL